MASSVGVLIIVAFVLLDGHKEIGVETSVSMNPLSISFSLVFFPILMVAFCGRATIFGDGECGSGCYINTIIVCI